MNEENEKNMANAECEECRKIQCFDNGDGTYTVVNSETGERITIRFRQDVNSIVQETKKTK